MLNEEQQKVCTVMEKTKSNLFITGKAGTGKSYLIEQFMKTTKKRCALLAPTGVAALNIGGQTIHSFFHLMSMDIYNAEEIVAEKKYGQFKELEYSYGNKIRNLDVIIIDEISMVRSDVFNTINEICKAARHNQDFFGGIQVFAVGDLYQLPPVVKGNQRTKLNNLFGGIYFFKAPEVTQNMFKVELKQVVRQKDPEFVNLLNNVRLGKDLGPTLSRINKQADIPISDDDLTMLTAIKDYARDHNAEKLSQLPGNPRKYKAKVNGQFKEDEYPTEEELQLKVGARVMLLYNSPDHEFVNGSLAKVLKLSDSYIEVELEDEQPDEETGKKPIHVLSEYTWSKYKFESHGNEIEKIPIGSFTQIPVKLAWAVTIHKSQGLTFDSICINMQRAFDHGQAYVALSRCKDLNKLYLTRPITESDVKVDPEVTNF